jgi:hypothetical protein
MILDGPSHEPLKIDRGTVPWRSVTSKYIQILLWQDRRGCWQVRVQHKTRGYLGWGVFRDRRQAEGYFDFLVEDWTMRTNFTKEDSDFLRECGIADAAPSAKHPEPHEIDDTCRWLMAAGVEVTAENWMTLNFAGHPPAIGEVDGEILADLPDWVRAVYDPDFEPDEED